MIRSLLLFLMLMPCVCQARWADKADAEAEVEFENVTIDVQADGTSATTIESQVRVLKESGRAQLATKHLTYNSDISSLKVLAVKTINDGKSLKVRRDLIEDKPLASTPDGFDQLNQVLIAYPEVRVGSQLYLKYQIRTREVPFPGYYSSEFVYGAHFLEDTGHVVIHSKRPLFFEKNDAEDFIEVLQSEKKGTYVLEATLKRPVLKVPVDEPSPHLDLHKIPWLEVSTMKTWPEIVASMAPKYEQILSEPLPPIFAKIRDDAKAKTQVMERVNTITSELADSVNYLGDWKSIRGKYIPRELKKVAETRHGDCKDFSAVTAAILRSLGMQANIAFVWRGYENLEKPTSLPGSGDFNHAIVELQVEGKTYWIDPTNFASDAGAVFHDIMDRQTLVLTGGTSRIERIPLLDPENSKTSIHREIVFEELSKGRYSVGVAGRLELQGAAALSLTGLSLKSSKQSIDYMLLRFLGDENRLSEWKVSDYDLSSRVRKDLDFSFSFNEKNTELKTSAGTAYLIEYPRLEGTLMAKTQDRVTDIFLGAPARNTFEYLLKGVRMVGKSSLDCSAHSKWVDISRKIESGKEGISVHDEITVKKSKVPNSDMVAAPFRHFQDDLEGCLDPYAVVFAKP